MAHRHGQAEQAHRKGIIHEAEELKGKGWDVRADLDGWPGPR